MKFQNRHGKSNKIGENDFGYWDYLKRTKPCIMTTEGMIMYRRNFTKGWLDDL